MAVSSYEKSGKTFWRVYVDLRGKNDPRVRVQKRINGIESFREAQTTEKKLLRELAEQVTRFESAGLRWGDVIERWVRQQELYPTKKYVATTIWDYAALLRNWTQPWLNRVASELNRGDGREIDRYAQEAGKSPSFRKHLKNTINLIYTWGIEERIINGVHHSPVYGLEIEFDREEKRPEILTCEEIRNLLRKAKEQNFPWYPVWVGAVLTGCRSGELHQIQRSDLDIIQRDQAIEEDKKPFDKRRYGFIRVRKGWNARAQEAGPTKAGYWRNVPVSSEFYWFLVNEMKVENMQPDDYLFPRSYQWDKGAQA
ncbi:MAG: hypothetical protein HQK54_18550, partial [Oligoflexales bacterium]|nr:hypothetical protein [Oligoflexales bacterium]